MKNPKQLINAIDNQRDNLETIKKAIAKFIKSKYDKNSSSTKFIKRYVQRLELIVYKESFIKSIVLIRHKLGIPLFGFDVFKDEAPFKQWLKENSKNNFTNVLKILENNKNEITTNPIPLLEYLLDAALYHNKGPEIYIIENNFVLQCPNLEIYENYITEKPFAGIFDYILFDKILIPGLNYLSIIENYSDKYILLALSANTTKRDILEKWPEISKAQSKMSECYKNKSRFKKNFSTDLNDIYDYDEDNKVKGNDIKITTNESINRIYNKNKITCSVKNDKKYHADRRKRKNRMKKLIESG